MFDTIVLFDEETAERVINAYRVAMARVAKLSRDVGRHSMMNRFYIERYIYLAEVRGRFEPHEPGLSGIENPIYKAILKSSGLI
jgi:hypothetical protein